MLAAPHEAELSALLAAQRDPASPEYQHWLTPEEFGRRFGVSGRDLRRVSRWLRSAGCRVRRYASRRLLVCRGPATLAVPPALADVVVDALPVDGGPPLVFSHHVDHLHTDLFAEQGYVLSPAEFQRIYALGSANGVPVDGTGQTIGIVGASAIDPNDVALFRVRFGLPPLDLEQDGGGQQPGSSAEVEAVLDVTWSGAVAPGARVVLAVGSVVVDALAALVDRPDVSVISQSVAICPGGGAKRLMMAT